MRIKQGDNLASTIDDGEPYAVYTLDRDYIYDGSYEFDKPCVLRSASLPQAGQRVTPSLIGPTIKGQLIVNVPGVMMQGIRVEGTNRDYAIIENYGNQFLFDRCYATGVEGGQRRGVYLAANAAFLDSHIDNIVYPGNADAQAIVAEHLAHDVIIDNTHLEAAGEVVMVGGGDIGVESDMCSNWTINNSLLTKNLKWRNLSGVAKNIFELKAIRGCLVKNTIMQHSWADAQIGFAVVMTPRNQYGNDPFSTVEDVLFDTVFIQGCAGGISILGRDDINVSERMKNITFRNVIVSDISRHTWGGNGRCIQILGGPKDLVFDGVKFIAGPDDETATDPDGRPAINQAILFDVRQELCEGLVIRNTRLEEGAYGIHSGVASGGLPSLDYAAPGYQWQNNVIKKGGVRNFTYPSSTVLL